MKKEVKNPEWIFQCMKCSHLVYVGKERLKKILTKDCPDCGEEADENWIFIGEGDYEKTPYRKLK